MYDDQAKQFVEKEGRHPGSLHPQSALSVYVASPLGFADSTRLFMERELIPAIKEAGVEPINPWETDPKVQAIIDKAMVIKDLDLRRAAWAEAVRLLGKSNAEKIHKADGVVAVLDGVDVDSGTAAEIGYAAALGKWIIGYRGDSRRTGEDLGAEVNLQVEYFITMPDGVIVHTLAELKAALENERKARGR
jgi:nucleoside 2-deoxyribosyltransferase